MYQVLCATIWVSESTRGLQCARPSNLTANEWKDDLILSPTRSGATIYVHDRTIVFSSPNQPRLTKQLTRTLDLFLRDTDSVRVANSLQ